MALFDGLSRKASEVSAKAVQKTKEFSEATRINALISEEEKKINNNYYQIGKLYFSLHISDSEPAFSGMVDSIIASEKKISDYRIQVQEIRGIQKCEKCGAEVMKGVAFCGACGTPVPKAEVALPDGYIKCDGCGKLVQKGMRFCTVCGKTIVDLSAAQEKPQFSPKDSLEEVPVRETVWFEQESSIDKTYTTVQGPSITIPAEATAHKCSVCGAELEADSEFCAECGTRVKVVPATIGTIDLNSGASCVSKHCPSCNAVLDTDDVFCAECGYRI